MPSADGLPTIEELRTFLALAETEEQGAVAKTLGIDKSVVSRRLAVFREAADLLEPHGPRFTPRGRDAIPVVRELVRLYDEFGRWFRRRSDATRVLVVATGSFGAIRYLPRAVATFAQRHPDWRVRVHVCRGRDRVRGVVERLYDLAVLTHTEDQIRFALPEGQRDGVRIQEMASEELVAVAAVGSEFGTFLAKQPDPVALTTLASTELVGMDDQSGVRRAVEAAARQEGAKLTFGPPAAGWLAAKEYARAGLGVALLPRGAARPDDSAGLVVRRVGGSVRVTDRVVYRTGDEPGPIDALREALLEVAR
jgi:DNA-binding transcriptional LysR family regulator